MPAPAPRIAGAPRLPPTAVTQESVYRLGSGDVIRVDVLGEAELSLQALIDPSGFINYPFLGGVRASGLTVAELETRIRNGLKSGYLVNPDVRVALAQFRPIFVSGQVRQTGSYPYSQDLTVDKALTLAGGLTAFASPSRIYIQRQGTGQLERVRAELDTPVFPGDTIVVEERLF